jgi:hypothetical protein
MDAAPCTALLHLTLLAMHFYLLYVRQSPVWPWPGAGEFILHALVLQLQALVLSIPCMSGYTLTRATHSSDRDLVPLTMHVPGLRAARAHTARSLVTMFNVNRVSVPETLSGQYRHCTHAHHMVFT